LTPADDAIGDFGLCEQMRVEWRLRCVWSGDAFREILKHVFE
jgi:hypothetical protein